MMRITQRTHTIMRQIWVSYPGPPEVLVLKEAAAPELQPSSVLIESKAIGINFADVLARMGRYPQAPPTPCVPGFEVAGIVKAVGTAVRSVRAGDRVVAISRFGGYSSEIAADQDLVFKIPDLLTFEQATTLPVNYLTALLLVEKTCNVNEGESVLVHSAAGGVGLALVELCKLKRAKITALASKEKHAFLMDRGATHCIDSHDPTALTRFTEDHESLKWDAIFDSRGGGSWKQSFSQLNTFGRLGVFGFSDLVQSSSESVGLHSKKLGEAHWFAFDAYDLVSEAKSIGGFNLATLWHRREFIEALPRYMEQLFSYFSRGEIRPHVGASFALEEASAAHRHLQSRESIGKIVLLP
jgi:synaptic vesicle membrane protein VAT-1